MYLGEFKMLWNEAQIFEQQLNGTEYYYMEGLKPKKQQVDD